MKVKYVVIPFRLAKGRYHPGEMREASSEARAVDLARAMSERFTGVLAVEVYVDEDGCMHAPRELAVFGRIPEIDLAAAA